MNFGDEEGAIKELKAQAKNDVGIDHGELKNNRKGGGYMSDSKVDILLWQISINK